jgi:trans-aconitate methyltransferase
MSQEGYDTALREIFGSDLVLDYQYSSYKTPRENSVNKKLSVTPLWYLQFLANESPTQIVDIGCGGNFFKSILKKLFDIEVHGIDPYSNDADEIALFDSDFSRKNTNKYSSVFSINALHYVPLASLSNRIKEFHNVVAPGGYGFLALNSARMLEFSDQKWLVDMFDTNLPEPLQVQNYVSNELVALDIDFLVKDLIIVQTPDEYMDGNIRLVFKK